MNQIDEIKQTLNKVIDQLDDLSERLMIRELSEKDYKDINESLYRITTEHQTKLRTLKKPEFPPPQEIKEDFI